MRGRSLLRYRECGCTRPAATTRTPCQTTNGGGSFVTRVERRARFRRRLGLSAFEDDAARGDGELDGGVRQVGRGRREYIAAKHGKVGALTDLDRTGLLVIVVDVRRALGEASDRLSEGEPLLGQERCV